MFIVGMRREDKMRCSRGVHRWIMYKRRRGAVGVFIVQIIRSRRWSRGVHSCNEKRREEEV